MEIKRRTMRRENWKRIVRRGFATQRFSEEELRGTAGLIHMIKVDPPWAATLLGQSLTLVDDGFHWLQIAPEGKHWWLTVMFDREGKILQYYFDITLKNTVLDGGDSYFDDLFLDVVLAPGIGMVLLDEEELRQALEAGVIDDCQAVLARRTAEEIMSGMKEREEKLEAFCRRQYEELKRKINSED